MSFTDDSSDLDWKESKMKTSKSIKQEHLITQNKPKYAQKFCHKWLSIFKPWLTRCDDDSNKPFCRACQCRLDCNRCHLQRHERTTKHARNLEILVSKGESAARQNLSIRQERSKYYQQRKKFNSSLASSHDASELGADTTDDFIEEYVTTKEPARNVDPEDETAFQFVQAESAPGDQYTEETVLKQETISADGQGDPLPTSSSLKQNNLRDDTKKVGVKKERMKLLMQIQKDKNDLMDSFRELMGASQQQSTPKEKNHVDLFFESVSSSVKALSPKLIAETKMRVSQLICELELRALTENEANAGGSTAAVVVSSDTGAVSNAFIINQPVTAVVHGTTTQHHSTESDAHFGALS
ncbi:protein suppressor of variegation 3-7-like isoform X1 [Anastrepha obliqua]|uniref:protein suppressor of variegation 3-7-like isoform X1 n=2 Tax=Anastrepha obliqua TaxID=95512 RepID=UPI00240A4507|nr:protein suppressor of variegation 3-7-like isoform X1 [Anastrepha obliqua]